jgi:enolase-phosphatase E1
MSTPNAEGILLDIEGTTSSVRYVFEVLFPYARSRLEEFVSANWDSPELRKVRNLVANDVGRSDFTPGSLHEELQRQMDVDAKTTGLKELQGLIWRQGFLGGELRAHVYPDVQPALERWRQRGADIRIYSSGSIGAQKLFFGHTEVGNLLPYLSGHYDTTSGSKRSSESYRTILADWGMLASDVLFLSDVVEELDAARSSGMHTGLLLRPGNSPTPPGHGHPEFADFHSLG